MRKTIGIVLCLLAFFSLPTSAQTIDELYREQLEASGATALMEQLPQETKDLLERLGITELDPQVLSKTDASNVLQQLWTLLLKVAKEPLRSCGIVWGTVLIHAWVNSLNQTLSGNDSNTLFTVISSLSVCAVVMTPIAACITEVAATTETLSVFMMSFVPVYAGILLSGGYAVSAFSFQSVVLYAAQLLSMVSQTLIVPLMGISLGLGLVGSVTPNMRIGRAGETIGKTATWMLALSTLLFVGLLSLQNLAGSAADTLGNRAVRFSIATFVPVVGSSLSEAFTTVRSCVGVLRSTTGVFGIAASVAVVLPSLLKCLVWSGCLSLCHMCAEMFELQALTSLLKTAQTVVKCLIGIVCAGVLFAIIAVTVVTLATQTA